jgi:hypothetical protein
MISPLAMNFVPNFEGRGDEHPGMNLSLISAPPFSLQSLLPERSGIDIEEEQAEVKESMGRKRKKVSKACIYCQKSHMSCDRGTFFFLMYPNCEVTDSST